MNGFLRMCLNIITQIGPYLVVLLLLTYTIIPFNLICHAFKLVFHNWQGNIRPLRFPRCKAALSKAYRHSKP